MLNRPFNTVLARLGLVAAILATLMILAPVASAAEELEYEEGRTDPVATFSASDEDGDAIDWTRAGDDAGDFEINEDASGNGVLTFKKTPNYESPVDANKNNVYLVTVKASEASSLKVEITVTDKDEPGKVKLSQPQPQVGRGLEAELSDPDADVADEKWQWARGSSSDGPWTDIDKATSQSRSPVADDLGMYLRATVVYEDKFDTGKTESAVTESAVEERTTANAAPSFAGLDDQFDDPDTPDVEENEDTQVSRDVDEGVKGAVVGRPIRATDADNDVLLYSIDAVTYTSDGTSTAPASTEQDVTSKKLFSIDPRSGQLKTSATEELDSDDDGETGAGDTSSITVDGATVSEVTYTVTVKATDPSGASETQGVTVTVNDVNDAPKFATAAPKTLWVTETTVEGVVVAFRTGSASDAVALTTSAYVATDDDQYDAGGDSPRPRPRVAGPPVEKAIVSLEYSVEGPDGSKFKIARSDAGEDVAPTDGDEVTLSFKDHKPNYETQDEYSITIVVKDNDAPEGIGTVVVTVNVVNADDPGVVTPTQRQPQIGKEVVARLEDGDGGESRQSWQWYRNADSTLEADAQETALIGVNAEANNAERGLCTPTTAAGALCRIGGATSPNYTPGDDDKDKRLAARVTYYDATPTDGPDEGTADDGDSAHMVMQANVQEEEADNTAPKFSDDQDPNTPGKQADAERSVPENVKGANVGDAVTASDKDSSETNMELLIYSLSGADAASFTIVSGLKGDGSGAGQIKTAEKLDYETKDMYMVVVTATDPTGAADTINVNISVTDEDDKTVIAVVDVNGTSAELEYEEGRTDAVATFSASDEDGDAIDWTRAGDDAGDFEIDEDASGNGVLTFKKSPNYESPVDANKNNVYLVTVKASEASSLKVEITVTDKDEPGKVKLSQPQPQVGRGLEAELSDPDADVADEKWQWARGSSSDGPWTDIDKATSQSRSPVADDLGMYLRATVVYEDKFDTGKTESAVTESAVEERTTANAKPSFAGLDETTGAKAESPNVIIVRRDVDEGVKGAVVGRPIRATDADNDVLLYSIDTVDHISTGTDEAVDGDVTSKKLFSIDPRSGQLKTSATEELDSDDDGVTGSDDTTGTNDANGDAIPEATYTVMVKATDPSGASETQDVTVTVTDVNDAPKFATAAPKTLWVTETIGEATVGNFRTAEEDPGDASDDLTDEAYVATDDDQYDAGGDSPRPRPRVAGPPVEKAIVSLEYSVEGPDGSKFKIARSDAGEDVAPTDGDEVTLSFKDHKPNYETQDEYSITIVVKDNDAPEGIGTVVVTVNVVNADDPGVVTPTQRQPQIGKEVVARLEDGDGGESRQSWQWYRNADSTLEADAQETALIGVNATDGEADRGLCSDAVAGALCRIGGATSPNYTPGDDDKDERLAARVTYYDATPTDGPDEGTADDGDSAHMVMQANVQEEEADNTAPKFSDDQDPNTPGKQADAERSVPENVKGANVGDAVTASDKDSSETNMELLIYSLSGADAASFTIVSGLKGDGSGAGQIKTAEKLDYETKDMYMVVVTATDPTGAADTINVNISVTDEDDKTVIALGGAENTAPAFDAGTATRNVNENMYAGAAVGDPVTAMDAGDTVTYELTGSMYFEIDGDGQITTTMMLDHEAMSTHTVTVTATDSAGDSDSIEVTINVNNAHTGCDTAGNMGLVNDCEALLDSKDALGGSLNWAALPMSDWDGVTMSDGRVTAVDLRDEGLDGTIPGALGRLSALTSLNLRSNADLSGDIPGSLGDLSNLTVLNLHSNSHTGEIPDLSGTMLKMLILPSNELTGSVPAWLNDMTDMTELWLWGNQLTGALPDLSGMTSLEILKLNGNMVSGFDAAMLPGGLRWLIAGETGMGSTAPDLSSLMSLTTLWMNENGLTGAVPVSNIPASVTSLNLKGNMLSGTIPDMSSLTNLEYLRLHRNELSGDIPGTLGDLDNIARIWLYENDLTGISAGLDNASDTLTHLYLNGNSFAEGTCLPGGLDMVANNDFEMAGLAACGDGS